MDAADTLSFRGTVTDNNDNEGLLGADLELRNKQTCPLSNGSLDAQATATEDFYQTAELKVYSYTGAYVTTITKTCARFCTVFDFPTTSMAPGSYQGYVRFSMFGGYGYSDVQAFAINGESTTTKSWTENTELSAPPSVGAVNPLPFIEEETTETGIASTSTNGDGEYRLNVASPSCDSGCDCTLHIDASPPASFDPISASAPSPGVVVSATEIRYPYQSSGERTQNNFTVHYNGDLYLGVRKYYYAGTQRVAVREDGVLNYLLTDHLGSTSITANSSGVKTAEMRYKAWGEVRYASGTTPTDYTFTGQKSEMAGLGLMFYKSRWYDAYLNRWLQPDSIIPDPYNPLDLDRYSYARNNPLKYTDPNGHCPLCITAIGGAVIGGSVNYAMQVLSNLDAGMSLQDAALNSDNIDGKAIVASTVAGGVAGLTMGAGAALLGTSYIAVGVSGASAGFLGGQAGAITEATWDSIANAMVGNGFDGQQFLLNATESGFLDPQQMMLDAGTGMVTAVAGNSFSRLFSSAAGRVFGPKYSPGGPPIIKFYKGEMFVEISGRPGLHLSESQVRIILNALTSGSIDPATDILEEILQQSIDNSLDQVECQEN